jgi:competence protein ComEC
MPLFWLSTAFGAGILLGAFLALPIVYWLGLAALASVIALLRPHFARLICRSSFLTLPFLPVQIPLLVLSLFLGAARYQSAQLSLSPAFIAWHNDTGKPVVVEGIVTRYPQQGERLTRLTVAVDRLAYEDVEHLEGIAGGLLAEVASGRDWRYGDRLRLTGLLETPPEGDDFSYQAYLARQGVYSMMAYPHVTLLGRGDGNPLLGALNRVKERMVSVTYRIFPDPEASLLAGILWGDESGISADVEAAFRDTGTAHIIAISGFNMAIVAGLFMRLFGRLFGRWRGALVAVLGIVVYTLLVGGEPSVVRAAIMGGLAVFAQQLGRRQDGLNSLAFAAALMCLVTPTAPWDVGFQLSFTATLGLVLYSEPLTQAFLKVAGRFLSEESAQRLAQPVSEYLLVTLAAQLTTLPVILYHFHRVSLVSLVVNPAILPAQPAVMVFGGLAVLLGSIYLPLGQVAAYLALPFVMYTIRGVELFARIPNGSLVLGSMGLPVVFGLYALIFGATLAPSRLVRIASSVRFSLVLLVLGSVTALVWQQALLAPDGRLHLVVLDVGGGDALLIHTPSGRNLLVGGGSSTRQLSDALGRRLPPFQRRLDWLVVADSDREHISALPGLLERFPPGRVLRAGAAQGNSAERSLQSFFNESGLIPEIAQSGQSLDLGDGAALRVLYAGGSGAVLLLEWRNFRLLLPVGMDKEALKTMLDDPALVPVTALLFAESGSAELNPLEWMEKLRPQVALLSLAPGEQPAPEVIEALDGYTLLRTDRNGWIHLTTDGEQMWVEVENR